MSERNTIDWCIIREFIVTHSENPDAVGTPHIKSRLITVTVLLFMLQIHTVTYRFQASQVPNGNRGMDIEVRP